ncbi:quinone oxidoreductase [Streptomyces avermitilis]|uniref:Quinone oxidoreductase n=2 Tax=Streptomyces avermitilis TaxID=33903 RepID=Q82GK6_STRAW|nr:MULTISPECIES: zinc-binding dehydrogenase [Streptomyces]KUN57170.1 quinone oxidoreductase [Streptomyces avermitilis]MYS99485.1 zinc-binding dehydrogenase [Streptomyces sp. SID5469]OOV33622.1 quinone oxidoreductase [Streptomyces avermitilis]BAC71603.1 putative quinone oxidoreductase [Streptomyces avermitilis MA-4680 = NBRC 14893]BBJ51839.1 NADPH:quinone reductase [Streptomyces avermitilis]
MKAIAFRETGGPEVLRLVELPDPQPGPGEVLIRVAYAGVNYGEVQHRLGDFGAPEGETVTGLEAAGHIAALGDGVTGPAVGDGTGVSGRSFGDGDGARGLSVGDAVAAYLPDGGGYAEYVVAPAAFVFPLGGLDLRTGGGAALVLTTAYGVLAGAARIAPGETVLIHAAAGGVGSAAAQIARALGATAVYGTVGTPEKAAYAKRFGYDAVFVRDGFGDAVRAATGGRGVDIVLDPVGGPTRLAGFEVLAPFGRLAVYGEAGRHPDLRLPVLPLWKNNRTLTGYNIGDLARRDPALVRTHALAALALAAAGDLHIDITDEYALPDAPQAHRVLQSGANRGKAVLAVAPPRP